MENRLGLGVLADMVKQTVVPAGRKHNKKAAMKGVSAAISLWSRDHFLPASRDHFDNWAAEPKKTKMPRGLVFAAAGDRERS
jgi:hypothetical protein